MPTMPRRWLWIALALLLLAGRTPAGEHTSGTIDRLISAAWARDKVQPAPPADDPEFVRRVYLDLVGRIPSGDEVEHFCADPAPDKRPRLIDDLLAGGEFPGHWRENLNVPLMGAPA